MKRKTEILGSIIVLLALTASGCGVSMAPQPPPPPAPPQTATQTPVPVPTFVATLIQMIPSSPPTPFVDPLTPPVNTPTYTAWTITMDALEWGVSPDQRWVWALERGQTLSGREYLTTHFASQVEQTEWRIPTSPNDGGHPSASRNALRPLFWLPKEPYLFLSGDCCLPEDAAFFANARSLYRLNLETGQLAMIYPWGQFYHFSFPASGKYLLKTSNGTPQVTITRLRDSQTVTIALPGSYDSVGNAQWAPDGKHVLLRACDQAQDYSCKKTPLIVITPEKPEFQTMVSDLYQALEMWEGDMETITWEDETHVRLSGPKYSLVFDITTGVLAKATK